MRLSRNRMRTLFEFEKDKKRKAEDQRSAQDLSDSDNQLDNNNSNPEAEQQLLSFSDRARIKARCLAYVTVQSNPSHILFLGNRTEITAARKFALKYGAQSVDIKETNSNRLMALVRK